MDDSDWLAERFATHRDHLRAVANRMLGSASEADDAVQEAWLKTSRSETREVENLRAWLTTVVARVCLDMLRSRKTRQKESLAPSPPAPTARGPETQLAIADAIGPALQIVLEMLAPAERVAFVLHDMFDIPFDEIAPIIDRTPDSARKLASRARRRVRGIGSTGGEVASHRELVGAFLAASRDGNFEALVALLSPDVVLRADEEALRVAATRPGRAPTLVPELRGAQLVANAFKGRAGGAQAATIDGNAGAVWTIGGQVRAAFVFAIEHDRIAEVEIVMDPADLAKLDVEILGG